jgi:hypothetical protein
MDTQAALTEQIKVRMSPALKKKIKGAARADHRKAGEWIRLLIETNLPRNGHAPPAGSKRRAPKRHPVKTQ